MYSLIFCIIAGLLPFQAESLPTCAQIGNMSSALLDTLLDRPNSPVDNLRAVAIRLGFHDCVGGCNGCVNFNNPDNAGLQPAVDVFTSLYYKNGYNNIISLADFYALATTVSIRNAVQESNYQRTGTLTSPCPVPCFPMQWGRIDSKDCSNDNSILPSPTMTGDAMYAYFDKEFGFTKNQVVALMGAHSFGSVHPFNSGYNGKWTGQQNKGLSEVFYSLMIDPSVTFTNINVANGTGPKWEFKADYRDKTNAGFMFNTDFEVFYNLTLNADGQATCQLNNTCGLTNSCTNYCPKSSTFATAYNYATNCNAFMTDFKSVIMQMLAHGNSNLQQLNCNC